MVAYQVQASDVPFADLNPKITWSAGTIDADLLSDGDLVKTTALPQARGVKRRGSNTNFRSRKRFGR